MTTPNLLPVRQDHLDMRRSFGICPAQPGPSIDLEESDPKVARINTVMKRYRHTPEQALRKVREGERMLNGGRDPG